jgi:hypothetical protein
MILVSFKEKTLVLNKSISSNVLYIIIANIILCSLVIFLSTYISDYDIFNSAIKSGDLRYIEQAFEIKNQILFNPLTNSINPPIYPIFLYLISKFSFLVPEHISIIQFILYGISLSLLSIELFTRTKSTLKLFTLYLFSYLNPVIFSLNDGGVFPEFFTICLFILLAYSYLLNDRINNNRTKMLFSFISALITLTRFEFFILIIFLNIALYIKINSISSLFITLSFPLLFIAINTIKNYTIFRELKFTNYSSNQTKIGGILADASWHNITKENAFKFLPREYLEDFHRIETMSNINQRIILKDKLFKTIINSHSNKHENILCKLLKLIVPPPTIDIYTCCPNDSCKFHLSDYSNELFFPTNKDKIKMKTDFIFHWFILICFLLSLFINPTSRILLPFNLFFICHLILMIVIYYGLPRFNANYYPIFILNIIFSDYIKLKNNRNLIVQ